jgi:hypothetical protein
VFGWCPVHGNERRGRGRDHAANGAAIGYLHLMQVRITVTALAVTRRHHG